jgi:urate oxidase
MAKVARQQYGKERVRVMRVHREGEAHEVFEYEAGISLEGDFDSAYLTESNAAVVPTDTMKNTLQALGYTLAPRALEPFALAVAEHFLGKYAHITDVRLHITQKTWTRLVIGGQPHAHSFQSAAGEKPFVKLHATREGARTLTAGFTDLLILKTTASGFAGFPRCEFTTLPETDDRIFATSATGEWTFGAPLAEIDFPAVRAAVMAELLRVFATEYSPSVQRTLFQMGEAALAAAPALSGITLKLPNKHYLPVNLQPLGLPPQKELFLPTDEPHGQIEATITR